MKRPLMVWGTLGGKKWGVSHNPSLKGVGVNGEG